MGQVGILGEAKQGREGRLKEGGGRNGKERRGRRVERKVER